jgi:hypothetical protein
VPVAGPAGQTGRAATTAALLEDHPKPLLSQLQGQDGGQAVVEALDVFSGSSSVKIIPMQRFRRDVAGWAFPIRRRPGSGEYRYLRFAWRADGAQGIMLQLHDQRDWNIRYTAAWTSRTVAPSSSRLPHPRSGRWSRATSTPTSATGKSEASR